MASSGYTRWVNAGKPYTLMRPANALKRILEGHGLTVYHYPDESHLKANTPQDHTPFSVTGYPIPSAFGVGHALDVMPRGDNAAGRRENAAIARRLIRDRDADVEGVMWVKYINWTDEDGYCRQEVWKDGRFTYASNDRGHIHVSGYSNCDNDSRADNYDPIGDVMSGAGFPTEADARALMWRVEALTAGRVQVKDGPVKGEEVWAVSTLRNLVDTVETLKASVDALRTAVANLPANGDGGGSVDLDGTYTITRVTP